jgi:hypothetical protein
MATIIVFDKETTLRVDETIEEAIHQLSEASRGGRFALVHQADRPHHINPAAVAYVTEAALGSGPVTAP